MKHLILKRTESDKVTRGELHCMNGNEVEFTLQTLELPWLDNQKSISCIPTGVYPVVYRESPKYKIHLHVKGVPDRSYILIHVGNFKQDTNGCILPGLKGGDDAVYDSMKAMAKLMDWFPDYETTITVS